MVSPVIKIDIYFTFTFHSSTIEYLSPFKTQLSPAKISNRSQVMERKSGQIWMVKDIARTTKVLHTTIDFKNFRQKTVGNLILVPSDHFYTFRKLRRREKDAPFSKF